VLVCTRQVYVIVSNWCILPYHTQLLFHGYGSPLLIADAVPVIIADGNAPNKPEVDAIKKHSEATALAQRHVAYTVGKRQEAVCACNSPAGILRSSLLQYK
jgi:hypothetical protein